jgi:hypothetical protein
LKVNERRDDTTKPEAESRPARAPGRYYYDDATGYETYTPEEDEGAEDEGRQESRGREDDKNDAGRQEDGESEACKDKGGDGDGGGDESGKA